MKPKTKYISAEELFAELGYDPNEKETKKRLEKLQAKVDAVLLSDLRKAAELTQTDMAAKLDVSQNRISQIELADLEAMQLSTIRGYVEALGGQLVFGAVIKNKIVAIRESAPTKDQITPAGLSIYLVVQIFSSTDLNFLPRPEAGLARSSTVAEGDAFFAAAHAAFALLKANFLSKLVTCDPDVEPVHTKRVTPATLRVFLAIEFLTELDSVDLSENKFENMTFFSRTNTGFAATANAESQRISTP